MKKETLKNRKKMLFDLFCAKNYKPMKAKEIAALLQIPKGRRKDLQEVLDALVTEGRAETDARGRYRKKKKEKPEELVRGIFIGNKKGSALWRFRTAKKRISLFPKNVRREPFIWMK